MPSQNCDRGTVSSACAGYRRLAVLRFAQATAHLPANIRTMLLRSVLAKLDLATQEEFLHRLSFIDESTESGRDPSH
jgi:hypothetical protein